MEDIIRFVDSNNVFREAFYIEITESAFVEDAKEVIQGYYFCKPLPLEDFEKLIEKELI